MRKVAIFLVLALLILPVSGLFAFAEEITLIRSYYFSEEPAITEVEEASSIIQFPGSDDTFVISDYKCSVIDWYSESGAGHDDDSTLRLTHIEGKSYTSANNALRLTLAEPLPAGGVYRVVAWFYAPSELNPDKTTLTGPGFVINQDYGGDQGVSKFPPSFGTLPMDEWKSIDVILPKTLTPTETLDFRLVINDADKHPDVWYIDNIEIYQIGEIEKVRVPEWDLSIGSLAEAYDGYFLFGNVMEPHQTSNDETSSMYTHYYNAVTPENAFKPQYISPEKGVYAFDNADAIITWAEENNIAVHGHTLVWHSQSARWLNIGEDGTALTRAEAKANMEEYINTVAGHYAGKLLSWDVVNEAFKDGLSSNIFDWRNALRTDSPWYVAYKNGADTENGEDPSDYIYDAFVLTRLADPAATLYYNDYNETDDGKREAIALMAEDLNAKWKDDPRNTEPDRLLVEGLGMQAHYYTGDFYNNGAINTSKVEATIQRFAATGAKVSLSELDMPLGSYSTYSSKNSEYTPEEEQIQADCYKALFQLFVKYSEDIERVTIWGKADPQSWRAAGSPLLFDKYFSPKQAYTAVMQASPYAVIPEEPEPSPEAEESPAGAEESPADITASPADDGNGADDGETEGNGGSGGWIVWVIGAVVIIGAVTAFLFIKKKK